MTNAITLLILAMVAVETGGEADPDNAIGDGGKAVGCLQIWPITVEDVNRIAGTKYTLESRKSRIASVRMCRIYLKHYCTEKRLGRKPTLEDMARCWVAGPNGYKKECSKPYWERVEKVMKARKK